ncbi:selenium metabolism membrane protein YedE/FdhT [Shewanella sp. SNU WT4]|uniref:selenium metabolism membrane protein YedE/FdhT n=1 Tax=Shewanella sp. SNU WT4 TaxID=2590015 RepID=UPI00112BD46D|nr:selenium metabolism membrane protein YedE/FdhT [Shewanella sp. SNU WT4]QDF68259.1 selenium metabolism membrane protein YedE/FdhT [Shewanella sp. SNU WT4]
MSWQAFKQAYLIKFWSPIPAVIAAGVMATYFFGLTGSLWAVTGEFTRWGGHLLQGVGIDPTQWQYFQIIGLKGTPLDRVGGMLLIGMFGGALAAALWANNVKLRFPQHKRRIAQALIGGMIAGFGARLAMGCNLAAFFTGIPQFSVHAWLFALATAAGSYAGARFCLLPMLRVPLKLTAGNKSIKATTMSSGQRQFRLGIMLFVALVAWGIISLFDAPKLGLALLFGVGFGLLIERAQICFTSAFRDMWITGRTQMAKAIILGMAVSAIGVFAFIDQGVAQKIMWAGPNAVIGGLLFGFGIVLAGGCETGWMYRAMEGQVHFWYVGIGNILGSILLAWWWDDLATPLATSWPKLNLLTELGPWGGVLLTYGLLALSFGAILLWERYFFKRAMANRNLANDNAASVNVATATAANSTATH